MGEKTASQRKAADIQEWVDKHKPPKEKKEK